MRRRDLILNNLPWKVSALILATIVWLTFYRGDRFNSSMPQGLLNVTGSRTYPHHAIAVLRPAGDSRTAQIIPNEVNITVRGETAILDKLTVSDLQAFVDLTTPPEPNRLHTVQVYLPRGLKIEKVEPKEVTVQFSKP